MGKNLLITGAGGQVGTALLERYPNAKGFSREDLDVRDVSSLERAVSGVTTVLHAAAVTNVDRCEADPALAHSINVSGTLNVARAAAKFGARVIFLSTDYVFDGENLSDYEESDAVDPINVYGETKAAAEVAVLETSPSNLVVRTSWVYGGRHSFIRAVLDRAEKSHRLDIVGDQVSRPTYVHDLVDVLQALMEQDISGILHVAGGGEPCSRTEWVSVALSMAHVVADVTEISAPEWARRQQKVVARRPRFSALSIARAERDGFRIPEWKDGLVRYLKERM